MIILNIEILDHINYKAGADGMHYITKVHVHRSRIKRDENATIINTKRTNNKGQFKPYWNKLDN